jgi:RimJ/RimL family protein N-acetyltransferase
MVFDFHKSYVLENDRVRLVPLEENHFDHLLRFAINESEIWQYSMVDGAGEAGLKSYLQDALSQRTLKSQLPFAVWDKKSASYAGSTRFYDFQWASKCVQLGYTWYGKEYQGTGINLACKSLLLKFAFEQMDMLRVELRADAGNARSIAAMKKLGFVEEGVLRKNGFRRDGTRRDSLIFSILKEEWRENPLFINA